MNAKKTIFLSLFLLYILNIAGYNLRQISNENGLSNSAILSISQDSEGYLWFGSADGLNMFNGVNLKVYKPRNSSGNLSGNLIQDIIETEKGIFWINTNYGLNKLNKYKQISNSFKEFKGSYFLKKDRDNNIFILQDSLLIYKGDNMKDFEKTLVPNIKNSSVLNLTVSSNNKIWIFTADKQSFGYTYNITASGIILEISDNIRHDNNLLYCFDEKNKNDVVYFVDESHTLYEYNLIDKKKYYVYNLSENIRYKGEISSIIKYNNDYFIGFKTNGLLLLKNIPEKQENYQVEEIDIKAGIFCLLKDRFQDIVWIGTDGQGVYMYSDDTYSLRSTVFGNFTLKIEKPVRAIHYDSEKTLWIGTKGDGILKIYDYDINKNILKNKLDYLTTSNSLLKDNSVYAFCKSKKNILWIGGDAGLNYYSYKDKKIHDFEIKTGDNKLIYVHSICEFNDSTLWIATVGTGLVKVNISWVNDTPILRKAERRVLNNGETTYNYFFTAYKESDSNIWFGNRGYGAYLLDKEDEKLSPLVFDNGSNIQTLNDIFSINKDNNGNIWFGTSYGLIKYKKGDTPEFFNEKDGFPNNTVHGILSDSQDNLWLSTNQGIIKFNTQFNTFRIYDRLNGLKITEYSDGAYHRDEASGLLFFGGVNGFTTIAETLNNANEYLPPFNFENLTILGQDYNIYDFLTETDDESVLNLNYQQNFFSISFTAVDYINGDNYSYLYKLDKVSDSWIDNGISNSVSFTNILPGKYTLHVKYLNKSTGKSSPVYSIILNIRPPWYKSVLAYVLYFILLALALGFFIREIIIRSRRKRKRMLEKLKTQHQEEVHESKLRFFTNIAHEFCTPLTLIYGPCNRILSHKESDSFVLKYTQIIKRNAERLNILIQELIEFRQVETGERAPQIESLPISDMANYIIDAFNDNSESKGILLEKDIQPALFWNSDKGFFFTILSNFISCMLSLSESKGEVRIAVKEQDKHLSIIISGSGETISKDNLELFFDKYKILEDFENQENRNRNNLGVAIAYNLVKSLNGTIKIDSGLNEKTDIIIKIPECEVNSSQNLNNRYPEITVKDYEQTVVELPDYEFDSSKPTMVIIDSDIEILWMICEIFVEQFNVLPIDESIKIEPVLNNFHPNIIIADVTMNGIAFTNRLKSNKSTAHIPIILISAQRTVEEQIEGLEAGAEMYITKPFNVDYLTVSVNRLISRKETLKDYFSSPLSAYDKIDGRLMHKDSQKFMQDIVEIIRNNINNKNLSVGFIASELGMSTRHLHRRMNEIGSKSPLDLIKDSKLHVARNFLINTKMTIDEIIYKSGFSNRTTFFKTFSEKYGCTPKEYRDNNEKGMTE